MMTFRKKEIVAASLVVLIGMAGYLNWSYQDTIHVRDNESYVETGKMLGEAEMVSANNSATEADEDGAEDAAEETAAETGSGADEQEGAAEETAAVMSIDEAKMNREAARSKAMEVLKSTSADGSIDEATRTLAGEKLVSCAANIEKENEIESVAAAKGFSDVCAYINEETATITVKSDGMKPEDIQKLTDVVISTGGIKAQNVKIVEIK